MNKATIAPHRANVGDFVDAEYIADGYGTTARLRGIVTHTGEWEGMPTHSVQGAGSSTMSNAMPVHPVARAGTAEAEAFTAGLLHNPGLPMHARAMLRKIAGMPDGTTAHIIEHDGRRYALHLPAYWADEHPDQIEECADRLRRRLPIFRDGDGDNAGTIMGSYHWERIA